jgi:hypothetical protein
MGLNLDIPVPRNPVKLNVILPASLEDDFRQYVGLAQKDFPGTTADVVLATILENHMKKDRFFQDLKKQGAGLKRKRKPVQDVDEQGKTDQEASSEAAE